MRKIFLMATAILCAVVYAAPQKGTVTDPRDGQIYKTVTIGTQTWMAENLKLETSDSWCYGDEESNCKKYGRLYTWDAAMEACPSGWHLPSRSEFETLFEAVGGISKAGKMLKSKTGWNNSGNGTDAYAFSALPAGLRSYSVGFSREGLSADFWSSTENRSYYAYNMSLYYDNDNAYLDGYSKSYGFSVRCLKD